MRLLLDLHENSLDFLRESIESYLIADEYGTHLHYKSLPRNKVKWKIAYICLVSSFEIMFKKIIQDTSPALIKVDIDSQNKNNRTIDFQKSIIRIKNFSSIDLSNNETEYLSRAAHRRTQFIHYTVEFSSEEIKNNYSVLFSLYKNIYEKYFGSDLYMEGIEPHVITEISSFAREYEIFRGQEIRKEDIEACKAEIEKAQNYTRVINKDNQVYDRIRFGSENDHVFDIDIAYDMSNSELYSWEYCDDCGAKNGEYHLFDCDLEICPVCGWQLITCKCDMQYLSTDNKIYEE